MDQPSKASGDTTSPGVLAKPDIIPAHIAPPTPDKATPTSESPGPGAELTLEQVQERAAACQALVETIRHEEFGIGVELGGEQQLVAAKQREREGRGIRRLSLELYSKDTHFVLELIQNADDNSYPCHAPGATPPSQNSPTAMPPSLKFVLGEDSILVLNNEVGFSEQNIRAICDVGKSTKGAHRSGYIGQKGIGFKSVFRVTDTPAIHSNSFHICFDASSDAIGFILPHWCGEEGGEEGERDHSNWMTRIVLPLKPNLVASNMVRKFADVQPSLLLFLHRLRSITVEDEVSGNVRCMVRQDRSTGIVEIAHTSNTKDSTDRWFVVRKVLDNAKQFKAEVEATELALAFPLPADLKTVVLSKDLNQQQVFAFLPLRSYGFRFIIQGDFDLPSSRECVTSDSTWNQWLREEIPALFLQGLQAIKAYAVGSADMTDLEAVALFLQFVPLEGELLDFFRPLTAQVLNLLSGTSCLPVEQRPLTPEATPTFVSLVTPASRLYGTGALLWRQPSQVLHVRDAFVREHISQQLLEKALNLSYLHASMLPYVNSSLQRQLGIRGMTLDHLKEVADVAVKSFLEDQAGHDIQDSATQHGCIENDDADSDIFASVGPREMFVKWIANWLGCVHVLLEEVCGGDSSEHTLMAAQLRDLSILPLEDGSFIAAAKSGIFFPPDYRGAEDDVSDKRYKEIHEEMCVLDSALFEEGDDLLQSRLRKVLECLGVRPLQPADVIRHHILPQFKLKLAQFKRNQKKSNKLLVKYLQYVRECSSQRGCGLSEQELVPLLKDTAILLTNKGPKLLTEVKVHFSSAYASQPDIVQMFPGVSWVTVLPDYLGKAPTPGDKMAWVSFLSKIGVHKDIVMEQVTEEVPKDSPQWKELAESAVKRLPEVDCTLKDWQSSEFTAIVDSASKMDAPQAQSTMRDLVRLLDNHWDARYARYLETHVYSAKNDSYLEISVPSSFSKYLVQTPWLPSTFPVRSANSKVLFRGSELFNGESARMKSLLHTHVTYLDASLQSSKLLAHLQVKSSITKQRLLDYLISWSNSTTSDGDDTCTFRTSLDHMCYVYNHLLEDRDDCAIVDAFSDDEFPPLVFVPSKYKEFAKPSDNVEGRFLSIHDVCWMDPTSVLYMKQKFNTTLPASLPKVLFLHYGKHAGKHSMQEAFRTVKINDNPLIRTYVILLKYVSSLSVKPETEHVHDFTSVVLHLVSICTERKEHTGYLMANLKGVKIFPSHHRVWVMLGDCLLENDDPKDLGKKFWKMEDVHFIQWPAKLAGGETKRWDVQTQENKEEFLRLCKIPKLSSVVCTEIFHEGMIAPMKELKERISLWVAIIQQFLFHNCRDLYNHLVQTAIAEKLMRLQVFSTQELKCAYYIEHGETKLESPDPVSRTCALEIDAAEIPTIYVAEKKKDKHPIYVLESLLKLLASGAEEEEEQDFRSFLSKLLSELPESVEEVEQLAQELELSPLSDSEPVWVVPMPKKAVVVEEEVISSDEESEQGSQYPLEGVADGSPACDVDRPMTCWPPKAAIDPTPSLHGKKREPDALAAAYQGSGASAVVGEEEVREVRRKHSLENEQTGTQRSAAGPREFPRQNGDDGGGRDGAGGDRGTELRQRSEQPMPVTGAGSAGHTPGHAPHQDAMQHGPHAQHSEEFHDDHQHRDHLDEQERAPKPPDHSPIGRGHITGGPKQQGAGGWGPPSSPTKYPTTWQAMKLARNEIAGQDLVDIQHLVVELGHGEGASPQGDPIIPLMAMDLENVDDPESTRKIGRWGEEFVSTVLRRRGHMPNGHKIACVNWVNETEETGKPYDIEVVLEKEEREEGGEVERVVEKETKVYIEVKSTASSNKDLVAFSWNELKFAEKKRGDYHLYRVYHAGSVSHRLCQLENLASYLQDRGVRLMFLL